MDIYCCLETWYNSTETQEKYPIQDFRAGTRAQDIPLDTCVSPYPWHHDLQGGRIEWISASHSKEEGTDVCC